MKKLYLKSSQIFLNNQIISGVLEVENGKIIAIHDEAVKHPNLIDYHNNRIIPGLIDIHNHGFAGWSLTGVADFQTIQSLTKRLASLGVTSMLATSSLKGYPAVVEALKNQHHLYVNILGIHAEGPFLNSNRFGAAKPGTLFPEPNLSLAKKMIRDAKGHLKYVTVAPEIKDNDMIIDYFKSQGLKIAAGHTDATYQEIINARLKLDAITHLANAMSGLHHRDVGTLGAALLDETIDCEIIGDGLHICKEMLQIIFKLKNHNHIILVSDTTALAGLAAGEYYLPIGKMTITPEGLVLNEYGHISGSSKPLIKCVQTIHQLLDIPLPEVIKMASLHPARLLEVDHLTGSIEVNKLADITIIDDDFNVIATYLKGQLVYQEDEVIDLQNPEVNQLLNNPEFLNFYE